MQKNELSYTLIAYAKTNSKCSTLLNVKFKTIKLLGNNASICVLKLGKDVLDMTPTVSWTKEKWKNCSLPKHKTSGPCKTLLREWEHNLQNGENIYNSYDW